MTPLQEDPDQVDTPTSSEEYLANGCAIAVGLTIAAFFILFCARIWMDQL
jgi:hypothetical protein